MPDRTSILAAALAGALLFATPLANAGTCGLCAQEVHLTTALARCLLEKYQALATGDDGAIAIDLSGCEQQRSIIEPLTTHTGRPKQRPDLRFMVLRPQLDCLKARIEEPGRVRDPLTRIDLRACP